MDNDNGGKVDGTNWNSSMLRHKVHVLFYVDPDEKDTNNEFSQMLKSKKFSLSKYTSVAIINLDATWLPNFAIESSLEEKQKEFPNVVYVKDKNKILVKKWKLEDDSSVVVVFDKIGKAIYQTSGKITVKESEKIIKLIENNL